jgi:hypothetical protein
MRKLFFASLILSISAVASFAQTPASIENKLLSRYAKILKLSSYGQNFDQDRLEDENQLFLKELLEYCKLPATLTYGFPRLQKEINIVTSKDGRLRTYSWDMQSGGTMHEFDVVYQYRGDSGKVYSYRHPDPAGGFNHEIFQVSLPLSPIYLTVSTHIASGTARGETLRIARIDGDRLELDSKLIRTAEGLQNEIDFGYDFGSVIDRKERSVKLFKFDPAKSTFSFPVVIEDEKTPQGRVTNKRITYRFNGSHFVKTD